MTRNELLAILAQHGTVEGADLSGMNLRGTDLSNGRFTDCSLAGTDLSGALLRKARFFSLQLRQGAL